VFRQRIAPYIKLKSKVALAVVLEQKATLSVVLKQEAEPSTALKLITKQSGVLKQKAAPSLVLKQSVTMCDLRLLLGLQYTVITFRLFLSMVFLWFVTNVLGPSSGSSQLDAEDGTLGNDPKVVTTKCN
jgi:hypothetical protein